MDCDTVDKTDQIDLRQNMRTDAENNMTRLQITPLRLNSQQLSSPRFKNPVDVVEWFGAVQAQDYYGAKWSLGQRMGGSSIRTDDVIDKAFAAGKILRTHIVRPTWHFVTPADIRWLMRLTAPRINAISGHYYRKLGLDEAIFRRSNKAFAGALRDNNYLTRDTLRKAAERAGIVTEGLRFIHILERAELDEVICSGPRVGKQFTYALLDERAPGCKDLTRDEALAELARRYFSSRGPAMLQDFVWWSGLTVADAKAGIEMVKHKLVEELIDGKIYWLSSSTSILKTPALTAHLLPAYDEYLLAYKDRSAMVDPLDIRKGSRGNPVFSQPIVIGGQVIGSWKRAFKKDTVVITLNPSIPLSKSETKAVAQAAERYAEFLGLLLEFS